MFKNRFAPLTFALLFTATGMASGAPAGKFPTLDLASTRVIIVTGQFLSGEYLERFPVSENCKQPGIECIDLDPPPLRLRMHVVNPVYGDAPTGDIDVFTTSHYGIKSFNFQTPQTKLVLLHFDGKSHVMPRYARAQTEQDKAGEFLVPIWYPRPTFFLPCSVFDLKKRIDAESLSFQQTMDSLPPDYLQKYPEYYSVNGDTVRPRYGIYVNDIAAHLKNLNPPRESLRCIGEAVHAPISNDGKQ